VECVKFHNILLNQFSKEVHLLERLFDNQLLIGQSLACNTSQNRREAFRVIPVAVIEPECLLIQIARKVVNFTTYIRPAKSALEKTPVVFYAVGMDIPAYIFCRVVYALVDVNLFHALIGFQRIREKVGIGFNVPSNLRLKGFLLGVLYNLRLCFAGFVSRCALQQSKNNCLANSPASLQAHCLAFPFVHVFSLAADIGFIGFHIAGEFFKRALLHGVSNPMKDKPSGFLSHTKRAPDLVRTNPVLGIGNHPNGAKPFIQTERAILEDGSRLDGELLFTFLVFALPQVASFHVVQILTSALRAGDALRPTKVNDEINSLLLIGEIYDCLLQCFWFFVHVGYFLSVFSISPTFFCVKYIVTKGNIIKEYGVRFNVWEYANGGRNIQHPAPFPEALARDHILSWSNEGDTVLDPMMGSGTTGNMAVLNNRNFVGIEIAAEYMPIAEKRIYGALETVK
jgi:hypothetical protein